MSLVEHIDAHLTCEAPRDHAPPPAPGHAGSGTGAEGRPYVPPAPPMT